MAIYLIRLSDFKIAKVLVAQEQQFTSIAMSPLAPQFLLSSSSEGSIQLWNIENEAIELKAKPSGSHPIVVDFVPSEINQAITIQENGTTILMLASSNFYFRKGDVRLVDLKKATFDKLFNIETAKLIRWNQQMVRGRIDCLFKKKNCLLS
jgi:WD40 repeat protein